MAIQSLGYGERYSTTPAKKIITVSSVTPFQVLVPCPTIHGMDTTSTILRQKIKAARLHAGYTQEKMGELIGVSK